MIRKATAADLDGVAEIYTAILDREEATGHHWTNCPVNICTTRKMP